MKRLNEYTVDAQWHRKNISELMRVWDKAFRSYQLDPQASEGKGILALSRAVQLAKVALVGYAAGEMSLEALLRLLEKRVRRSPAGIRAEFIGTVVLRAQQIRPKQLGDQKPGTPRWIKAMGGEWMEQAIRENGMDPGQAAARTLKLLGNEGLISRKLTESAITGWHQQWKQDQERSKKAARTRSAGR